MKIPNKCWCPMCRGTRKVLSTPDPAGVSDILACPDCTDGLASLGRRLLVRCECNLPHDSLGAKLGYRPGGNPHHPDCDGTGWRLRPKAELEVGLSSGLPFGWYVGTSAITGKHQVIRYSYPTEEWSIVTEGKSHLAALWKAVFGEPLEEETCQQA